MKPYDELARILHQIIYRGDKHNCPVCSYRSRKLKKVGKNNPVLLERKVAGTEERNAACYRCHADDRERLIFLYLRDFVKLFDKNRDLKVFHYAPEYGTSKVLKKRLKNRYTAGDLKLKESRYPEYIENVDIEKLPYENDSFDIVICNHVFEYVSNDLQAMSEVYRILKTGGEAILQVPLAPDHETFEDSTVTTPEERETFYGKKNNRRIYGKDYFERLEKVGFKTRQEHLSTKLEYLFFELNPKEDVFIGKK